MVEQKRRSIAKAFSWRVTATVTTIIISFLITGSASAAMTIGAIEAVAKMVLYYIHERAWSNSKFGLQQPMDYHI